jgi:hypothetical protein
MLEHLYGKRSGSKTARADRKDGDGVGAGPDLRQHSEHGGILKSSIVMSLIRSTMNWTSLKYKDRQTEVAGTAF